MRGRLNCIHAKVKPPGAATPGGFLCLLALAMSVKPLADIVANYTCYDRDQKCADSVHMYSPPPILHGRRRAALKVYYIFRYIAILNFVDRKKSHDLSCNFLRSAKYGTPAAGGSCRCFYVIEPSCSSRGAG